MCTETAETAQRAKQSIESWLASSFATSGRWRPVVLLKDEMKLRGNLVATKKRTRATMKTDTVPPLSGPEFPCLHLCDANRETCNSGGKGNIEERGKLSLVNPSIDNSDSLVSDESPDTSGCSTGTTPSPIPRVQAQSISVVDLTNDTDADSDRYGLWKVGGSCTHTHMWPWIFFLGKRTVDEYPVAMRRSLCFFNVQLLLPLGSRLCAASRHKPEQPPSVGDGVSPMQNVDVTPHSSVKQLLLVSAHARARTTACSTSSSASAEKHVASIRSRLSRWTLVHETVACVTACRNAHVYMQDSMAMLRLCFMQ